MLPIKNTLGRYGLVTMILHWLMALIIIGLLIVGLYMVDLPFGMKRLRFYGWHKEFGILILMLVCIRLAWRMGNMTPPMPVEMPRWQHVAAVAVHYAFYFLMVALPITGWMISSASGLSVSFFGLFVLPDLITPNEHWRILLSQIHKWLAYGLIAAICGHMGAALLHHFYYKDDILRRMLP